MQTTYINQGYRDDIARSRYPFTEASSLRTGNVELPPDFLQDASFFLTTAFRLPVRISNIRGTASSVELTITDNEDVEVGIASLADGVHYGRVLSPVYGFTGVLTYDPATIRHVVSTLRYMQLALDPDACVFQIGTVETRWVDRVTAVVLNGTPVPGLNLSLEGETSDAGRAAFRYIGGSTVALDVNTASAVQGLRSINGIHSPHFILDNGRDCNLRVVTQQNEILLRAIADGDR